MACEPIYPEWKYKLIQFGRLLGVCQSRTRDGVAWEGELRLRLYRSVAWPVMLGIGLVVFILAMVI